jgi:phospholipid transport system substrate-binding protein
MWWLKLKMIFIVLVLLITPAIAGEPMAQLKSTIDKALEILNDEELRKPENIQKRRELLRQIIHERFDFEEMSKRSLALHWSKRSPEERREFVSLFGDLLERSYIKKIEKYSNEKVLYIDESIEDNYAVVKTKVITNKGNEIPINYRLMEVDSKWVIYDVVIEGVSLIKNYRVQFNKIIRTQSYEMLVKRMKNKLEEERLLEESRRK